MRKTTAKYLDVDLCLTANDTLKVSQVIALVCVFFCVGRAPLTYNSHRYRRSSHFLPLSKMAGLSARLCGPFSPIVLTRQRYGKDYLRTKINMYVFYIPLSHENSLPELWSGYLIWRLWTRLVWRICRRWGPWPETHSGSGALSNPFNLIWFIHSHDNQLPLNGLKPKKRKIVEDSSTKASSKVSSSRVQLFSHLSD